MNMRYDLVTLKSLAQNVYPRQSDREIGMYQADWIGSGATVTERHLALTSAATSAGHFASNPMFIMSLMSASWTDTYIYLATSTSGNGYKLTFATVSGVTQVKLERWDAGAGTSLGTYDCSTAWATTDKIGLTLIVTSGVIVLKLFDQVIIQSGDAAHRLTDWHLIVGGATVKVFEWHYLTIGVAYAAYQHSMLEPNLWASNAAIVAPFITLAHDWDAMWIYRMFPRSGFIVNVAMTPPANHKSRWGLVTPDKAHGLYIEWNYPINTNYYWKLVMADGSAEEVYDADTNAYYTNDFTLDMKSGVSNPNSVVATANAKGITLTGAWTTPTASGALCDGVFLHTQDISSNGHTCQIDSITLSPDSTYGFHVWAAREVGYNAQSVMGEGGGGLGGVIVEGGGVNF